MKIENIDKTITDTDELSDVDALLLEKGNELRELCYKYDRQLLCIVERQNTAPHLFFHMMRETARSDPKKWTEKVNSFFDKINGVVYNLSNGRLGLGHLPPSESSETHS